MSTRKSTRPNAYRVKHHDFSRPYRGRNGRAFLGEEVRRLVPDPPEIWQSVLVVALLFLLFSFAVLELQVGLLVFYALAVCGVVAFFRSTPLMPITASEQTGFLILLVFFLTSLLTYWINGLPGRGDVFVESRHAKLLLAIPVYLFFRSFSVSLKALWLLALAVSVFLFFVALIGVWSVDGFGWPDRASGLATPDEFAVVLLTALSLLVAFRDTWSEKRWPRYTARFGVFTALLALFFTKSLLIWPALPLIVLMHIASRIDRFRIRHALELLLGLVCVAALLYQVPVLKASLVGLISDYKTYMSSEPISDSQRLSEVGVVLENWRAAIHMGKENPFLGVGPGGYAATARGYFEEGGWAASIVKYSGPGNLYLGAFAMRGVFGFITTLLLMFAPLLYCYQVRGRVDDKEINQYAFATMLVVGVFIVAGLSVDVLEDKPLLLVFCTVVALLIGQIRQRIENE